VTEPVEPQKKKLSFVQLLPNVLTIIAICAGLTAIQQAVFGHYQQAVVLVLLAAVLDGLDGRLARALNSDSAIGAELDSLADFANFGVAPGLVVYLWALQDLKRFGWIAVMVFAVCCVVRLARFNVANKSEEHGSKDGYFVGVPAPAGALLVMAPMYLDFAFPDTPHMRSGLVSIWMILIGWALISRIPTWSFKAVAIPREHTRFVLVGIAFLGAAVLTFTWLSLAGLCLAYFAMVIWGLVTREKT